MTQHLVYVGIGSNIEQEKYIRLAVKYLQEYFSKSVADKDCDLKLSPVYKTQAIGFEGDDFFNLVASFNTTMSPIEVEKTLKEIEHQNGRRRNQEKFSARTLDIDLLLYDDEIIHQDGISVPRDEIEKYAFVLSPLADLSPDLIHPQTKKSMADMWQILAQKTRNDSGGQALEKIDFCWDAKT
ncbi:2-amino-4-hydroxy-6-hydroxymethyldihydropteridine diphosphokinase [sulfur-oxidizing endosymbiont of Gigantopelta aegis]|uniref:2-amino-4-hydroxy-6- hydroxymethyldihydropteridine diphosphokinase n=1 Tax=sulfur-oxidizing endosymbiont of Gigantopelta aegis TaxID=2794934 RepID=UPI0018DB6B0F|nr:2-amino-4-hydroxy-6-hydroxymethyldihydropteridine diphosphokinase [sulfur-oxidizing endosymbiont of Gigantopelta aegis]